MKYICENCKTELNTPHNEIIGYYCPCCDADMIPTGLKSSETLPDAVKFTDVEIPIESVKFREHPDVGRTLTITLDCGKTTCDACKLMGYSNNGFMTCIIYNLHLKPIVSVNDKNNIENYTRLSACIAACGGG